MTAAARPSLPCRGRWISTPSWHVDITGTLERKLEAFSCYRSQLQEPPAARSLDALRALAVLRGNQVGHAAVESFQVVRAIGLGTP